MFNNKNSFKAKRLRKQPERNQKGTEQNELFETVKL